MCNCKNIKIWSYDNQIYISLEELPKHMKDYWLKIRWKDHKKWICLDKCISKEVLTLWSKWIRTTWCCCWHNKLEWYIWVVDEDIQKMKDLWYKKHINETDNTREDGFIPKSI